MILINFPLKLSDSCLNIQQNLLKESFQNWGASYSIEFDIVVNKLPSSQWTNVFRFTATNGNFGSHGDRIPALFVNNNGFFSFRTSLNNQGDFESNINFVIGEPYHVIIQHFNDSGQYPYKIIMNDEVKEDKVNNNPQSWSNVNLYTSDSFETSFTSEFGSICNFTVEQDIDETVIATTTASSIITTVTSTASAGK